MLRDLGHRPAKRDLPPPLKWEAQVWIWFQRLATHPPMGGPARVDGAGWLSICDRMGWNQEVAFELLGVIQNKLAEPAKAATDD